MPKYTEEEKKLTERISKLIDNFPMDCTDGGDYSVCRPMITDSNTLAALIVKAVLAAGYRKIDPLTFLEVGELITCFNNESMRRYGKVNTESPLYQKLAKLYTLLSHTKQQIQGQMEAHND
jgi:hypothetical protein